jgi:hypothetical protein
MSKKSTDLNCVLDRFENSKAVLRFNFLPDSYQELIIAKRYIPRDVKEGDIIYLEMFSDKSLDERRKNLARHILEEILNGN